MTSDKNLVVRMAVAPPDGDKRVLMLVKLDGTIEWGEPLNPAELGPVSTPLPREVSLDELGRCTSAMLSAVYCLTSELIRLRQRVAFLEQESVRP